MNKTPLHSVPEHAEHTRRRASTPARRPRGRRLLKGVAAAGAAAAAYMMFEAQWIECREKTLVVPGFPSEWSGLRVLHLSDVHAGDFGLNLVSLRKAVAWAIPLEPDLVFLTGDILGDPGSSGRYLAELSRLSPTLGAYSVTGNHEYGIAKGPLARARDTSELWAQAGITLLRDRCVRLCPRASSGQLPSGGANLLVCGADYLTGGFELLESGSAATVPAGDFPILLVHEPPTLDDPLQDRFPLAFAGHTHGGQLRVPGPRGLVPLNEEDGEHLGGTYNWGNGLLVVSRGVGTSFVPFRLLTRPEATLWRLV